MGNFDFLRAEWPDLAAEAAKAEASGYADPRISCFYARRTLELAIGWLYDADASLAMPYNDDLSSRIFDANFARIVGNDIQAKADLIRRQGNAAVHKTKNITPGESIPTLGQLFQVLFWLATHYTRDPANLPDGAATFQALSLPKPPTKQQQVQRQAELIVMQKANEHRDRELAKRSHENEQLHEELTELRKQIAQAKLANESRPDIHDYDEQATRDLFIDVLLREAGWPLDQERDREFPVTGMPNAGGDGRVDYVLWAADGKPLAVVEAKRTRRDAKAGEQQARLYADCLETMTGQRPIIFYSNGYEHWIWDDAAYPPRRVEGFYTRDELELMIQRRTTKKPLADLAIDPRIVERHYQHRAIRRISETFEVDRQRQALVVMATGAGKTRTVIALADLLMRANWAKRVLFLADRVALVDQAAREFTRHLPHSAPVNLVTEKNTDGRVYICTYPTMMGLINEGAGDLRRFGPGYFDLIVIDEAHRSVYQKYRAIFSWFDALLVGLTATPKDEIDRNTYRLFNLQDGVPTDAYPLDQAVEEGYLVPPRAVSVPLKFPREGIRYVDLTDEEKDEWDAREWDADGDVPEIIASDAVNRWLFNEDTVDKVLETLMILGHKVAGGDRLGKTIVFARNDKHAQFIRERFDASYPEFAGTFARVITYKTEYAKSLIDAFSIPAKSPSIAISVDLLDTGIDVPDVVNLVLFKPVRSKTKFWQMIGRGTRLRPELFGPGQDKTDFYVFDVCGNFEFFNLDPTTADGRMAASLVERLFAARLELLATLDAGHPQDQEPDQDQDGTTSERALRFDVAHTLHDIVLGMNVHNFVVRPHRRWVELYADDTRWHHLSADEAQEIAEHLAGLPSSVRDDDEAAKRFDLLILRLQLGRLNAEPGFERLRDQVRDIASALLEIVHIPAVAAHHELLDDLAGDEWWIDVTLPMLELARRRIRSLVRLMPVIARKTVYTDFEDQLGDPTELAINGLPVGTDLARFTAKVRVYLAAHADHLALQKVRRNRPLTAADLAELERMLTEAGAGDPAQLAKAAAQAHGLGLFIRGLVGLDRDAATDALAGFIRGRTLTANQLDFVNLIITYLTEHGVMDIGRLYDSPFTDHAPTGPDSLFAKDDLDALLETLALVEVAATPSVA